MRSLKFYTSLWAMMPHDDSGETLPYDAICEMVAGAGYNGMAIDLGAGDVAQARDRELRHDEHVAEHVHAAAARAAGHLPELVGSERAVAGHISVVGLVELREDHRARGHVDADGEGLGGEDQLDQLLLEAQLDVLAQHGEHA